ncbi:hypothetical protein QQF64_017336 [Cirrhinus molitorella]|uniref:Uncharacterized protein n=1 Tax=Cirrhinus molitorella TaxID=172907 RepID=A0ABR3LIC6_9TELE
MSPSGAFLVQYHSAPGYGEFVADSEPTMWVSINGLVDREPNVEDGVEEVDLWVVLPEASQPTCALDPSALGAVISDGLEGSSHSGNLEVIQGVLSEPLSSLACLPQEVEALPRRSR